MAGGFDAAGAVLTHSDISGTIIDIGSVGASRETIETTALADATNKTFIGATLYEGSEVSITLAGAVVSTGTAGAATSGSISFAACQDGDGAITFTAVGLGSEVNTVSAGEKVTSTARLKIVTVSQA